MSESLHRPSFVERIKTLAASAPAGCFAEIGVWEGGVTSQFIPLIEKQKRDLHLFDLFEDKQRLAKVKKACPKAILHPGAFPGSYPAGLNNVAFCFFDIDDRDAAKALLQMLPTILVPKGIALFTSLYSPRGAVAYRHFWEIMPEDVEYLDVGEGLVYPAWTYPYIVNK